MSEHRDWPEAWFEDGRYVSMAELKAEQDRAAAEARGETWSAEPTERVMSFEDALREALTEDAEVIAALRDL